MYSISASPGVSSGASFRDDFGVASLPLFREPWFARVPFAGAVARLDAQPTSSCRFPDDFFLCFLRYDLSCFIDHVFGRSGSY